MLRPLAVVSIVLLCVCPSVRSDVISAYLTNADDYNTVNTNTQVQMKYTSVAQNLGGFEISSSGTVKFLRDGVAKCHIAADVRVRNVSPFHSVFTAELNGVEWSKTAMPRLQAYNTEAAQMQLFFADVVATNDELSVFANPYTIEQIGGFFSHAATLSCMYVNHPNAEVFKATYTGEESGYVAYSNVLRNTNTSVFQPSGAYLYVNREGLVSLFASTTGSCSSSSAHCHTYFIGANPQVWMYNSYPYAGNNRGTNVHVVTLHVTAGNAIRLNRGNTNNAMETGNFSILSAIWQPLSDTTDFHVGRYNNEADFESDTTNTWKNVKWGSPIQPSLGSGALTLSSNGTITVNRAGVVKLHFNLLSQFRTVSIAQMRLLRDGAVVAGAVQADGNNIWGSAYITWYAHADVGTTFEFQLNPSQHTDVHSVSSWNHVSFYWQEGEATSGGWPGQCANGTANDPLVELPSPSLQSAGIASNNYNLVFGADERFSRLQVFAGPEVDNNNCNYDSDGQSNAQPHWSVGSDAQCTGTLTMNRAVQDMLATCTFTRSDTATQAEYTKDVTLVTTQARSVSYAQGFRNFEYTEVKSSRFTLHITVPKSVTVTSTNRQVTGNVTVLQAITALRVDVDSNPYQVSFSLLTSSQAPYQLTYQSFTSSAALADTINVNSPDCADTAATTTCLQTWDFSGLDITDTCPTKSTLNDALTVTFSVGCKASFTGNCITPLPSTITVSFTLSSTPYCPQVEDLTLSATMDLYRDVSLEDSNAWVAGQKTNQFVVGATTFGEVAVTVSEDAATTDTTVIRTITTTGHNNQAIVVYSSSTGVGGTDVHNSGFPEANARARFSIPLVSGTTVELDPVLDAAQTVTIQVVLDVTYTVSGDQPANPVLASFHKDTHSRSVRVQRQQTSLNQVSGTVVIASATSNNGAAPSGSSSSAMPMSTVAVIGALVVVLVIAVTYKAGQRRQALDDKNAQSESVSMGALRSSSCSAVDVHAINAAEEASSQTTV